MKEFRKRKFYAKEHLADPHPFVTVLFDDAGAILCMGTNREKLAAHAFIKGWTRFEMKDFALVV